MTAQKTDRPAGQRAGQVTNKMIDVLNIPRDTGKRKRKISFPEAQLLRYKERLLSLPYTTTASRIIDCIDFILEHRAEVPHG